MVNGLLIWDYVDKENTISSLENNLSDCLDDGEDLVNLVSELENRNIDLEADINFYEYNIENLQNEKTNLEIELMYANNQINNLHDDVLELNETNNKLIQLYSGNGLTSFFDNLRENEGLTGGGAKKI
jgi:chromosome segregation ATPase